MLRRPEIVPEVNSTTPRPVTTIVRTAHDGDHGSGTDLTSGIKKGPTGKFRFNLLSSNGQVVATSEAYNSKASAMGGVRSVKSVAADAEVEDQTT